MLGRTQSHFQDLHARHDTRSLPDIGKQPMIEMDIV